MWEIRAGRRLHPRGCGTLFLSRLGLLVARVYPRMFGVSVVLYNDRDGSNRCIPVSAGPPRVIRLQRLREGVYPRRCGADGASFNCGEDVAGVSPRVRGLPMLQPCFRKAARVYPRGCGAEFMAESDPPSDRVYPRGRGVGISCLTEEMSDGGVSPRLRGRPHPRGSSLLLWCIPAAAGPVSWLTSIQCTNGVYPRGCGVDLLVFRIHACLHGVSPWLRGRPLTQTWGLPRKRCIPAAAGSTVAGSDSCWLCWVYPRGCGVDPQSGIFLG